jgi:hypothetical protein
LSIKQRQIAQRQANNVSLGARAIVMGADWVSDEINAGIVLFVSLLDENQRRLFAELEAIQFGHRGDSRVADYWVSTLIQSLRVVVNFLNEIFNGKVSENEGQDGQK